MMRVVAAGLLAVLGLALMAQVQTRQDDDSLAGYREEDLLSLVTGLSGGIRRSEQDLAELRTSQAVLRASIAEARTTEDRAEERTAPMSVLAGRSPAAGEGLVVRVEDPEGQVASELLLDLVEDLRTAGASAIEINDEVRVGAGSWFAGEAGAVVVDDTELERPYVIDVLGRPDVLRGALAFPQGGADRMEEKGAAVTAGAPEVVEVTSTRPLPPLQHADPTGPLL